MAKKYLTPIDLNKNELQNARVQNLATAPATPAIGQIFYDTTNVGMYCWNGTAWRSFDAALSSNIPNSALATNPLARVNHTGSQLASTISNLASTVQAYTLNQFAAPTASVSFNSQKLTNLAAPTAGSNDAARIVDVENAVQSAAASIDSKESVRLVAVANLTLSGLSAIDGVTPVAGNRILVTAQTTASQNGVYVAASGAWTRATDTDATGEITPGAFWFVEEGTTYGKTQWRCNNTGTITIGTTAITIFQFGAASMYSAGTGLTLTGTAFAVGAGTGITVGTDSVSVDTTVVARKATATIGNDSATSITVTHNLNNQGVLTSVREIATGNIVECDVQNNGVNTIVLSFATAPTLNSLSVSVVG